MGIFLEFVKGIGLIILLVIILYMTIILFQALSVVMKNHSKKKHSFKKLIMHKLWHLRDYRYFGIFEFVKWVSIDFIRGKDYLRLYGIWCFTGYYGTGKTFGAVNYALKIRQKYPDVKIYANFYVRGQDGVINSPQDILDLEFTPGRKIIIFDEIQSTFTSTKYASFPIELLWGLTQCRKNSMCIFASSPVYTRMSIQLRESTDKIIVCKNVLGLDRWFRYHFYEAADYECYMDNPVRLRLAKKRTEGIFAHDRHYKNYKTKQIVDRWEIDEPEKTRKYSAVQENRILKKCENLISEKLKKVQ